MTKKEMRALCKEMGIILPTNAVARKRVAEERCVFCGGGYAGIGNNPAPVIDDKIARCCDFCNGAVILTVRFKLMGLILPREKERCIREK